MTAAFRRTAPAYLLTALLFLSTAVLPALQVPPLQGRVNDRAGVLSRAQADELERYLTAVEENSSAQIALLTIPSLENEALESYSLKVVDTWRLGSESADNGVLLLVAMEERKIRIEVGYGLEALLTDAVSGYIIRESIVPEFRDGRFDQGIEAGLKAIGGVVTGDAPLDPQSVGASETDTGTAAVPFMFIIFLIFFVLARVGRYRRYRRRGMSPLGAFFLGSMLGSSSRSGRSSGGFSGGGGGFSGGGGGFGGGGASGGW